MKNINLEENIYDKNGNLIDKSHPKYFEAQEGLLLSKIKEIQSGSKNNSRRSSLNTEKNIN